ncbi:hypothetical protein [Kitasatospora sp. NPDC098663]|uniref:hypothetical protein n=1 Tax=Kitasatospora sp. NPDC098663 TaxID=3364096 RepID=UPI003801E485
MTGPFAYQSAWASRRRRPNASSYRSDAFVEAIVEVRNRGFEPEDIPQSIPEPWFEVFANHSDLPNLKRPLLRRSITIQLIQSVIGLNFLEAAEFRGRRRPAPRPGAAGCGRRSRTAW